MIYIYKKTSLILLILFSTIFFCNAAPIKPDGDGSYDSPFLIIKKENFEWIGNQVNTGITSFSGRYFILKNSIDMGSGSQNFTPIGYYNETNAGVESREFSGDFNGNNFVINNLYYNNSGKNFVGLFGATLSAKISNVVLKNAFFKGRDIVGSLVGSAKESTFYNCKTDGEVSGRLEVGGLFGIASNSNITNCGTKCNVKGTSTSSPRTSGGFAAIISASKVKNSFSTGNLDGELNAGGFIGFSIGSSIISDCYSTGNVKGTSYVGGFIGWADSPTISNCYCIGDTTGSGNNIESFIGYLIGSYYLANNYWNNETKGVKKNSYYNVTGISSTEFKSQEFLNLLNSRDLKWGKDKPENDAENNGFPIQIWRLPFYDFYLNGNFVSLKEAGTKIVLNAVNLPRKKFDKWTINAGVITDEKDKTTDFIMPNSPVSVNANYLDSIEFVIPNGEGSIEKPYEIIERANLEWLADQVNNYNITFAGKFFLMVADIEMGGNTIDTFLPIGKNLNDNVFSGNFDGNNKVIKNLFINSSENFIGLFGYGENANIDNLGLENIEISGNDNTGGVFGKSVSCKIVNCFVSGKISGKNYVGGFIANSLNSTIKNSFVSGNISGENIVGGIIGETYNDTLENVYVTADISGETRIGGILGYLGGMPSKCSYAYVSGKISGNKLTNAIVGNVAGEGTEYSIPISFPNVYWDKEKTTQNSANIAIWDTTKLQSSEMQNNHDFINKLNKNQNEIFWKIDEDKINNFYPILLWQINKNSYELVVKNGSGSGFFLKNSVIEIEAEIPLNGEKFSHWESNNGGIFTNVNSTITTFEMPAKNVILNPIYNKILQNKIVFSPENIWVDKAAGEKNIIIYNNGENAFNFKIDSKENWILKIEPRSGTLQSGGMITIAINYDYNESQDSGREAKLIFLIGEEAKNVNIYQDFNILSNENNFIIISINEGWNLLSLPFSEANLDDFFAVIESGIWTWNGGNYTKIKNFDQLPPLHGFWVYSEENAEIKLSGKKPENTTININNGWNLYGPSKEKIIEQNFFNNIFYWDLNSYESTEPLTPGKSYWFFSETPIEIEL